MRFDVKNKNDIKTIPIHDSVLVNVSYDYNKRQFHITCDLPWEEKKALFVMNNVIHCEIQSCSFWHGGNNVMCVYAENSSPRLDELIQIKSDNNYSLTYLDEGVEYITVIFLLNSGDTIQFICEYFTYFEEKYI